MGVLPSVIVFILKMIPNSWAGDHLARVPGAAQGEGRPGLGRGCARPAPGARELSAGGKGERDGEL